MQIAKLNPDGRIELTMRGEPLLSPHMLDNISIIRERMPKVQISLFTNGIVLFGRPTLLVDIVDAGVNILCIDCYGNTYDRFERLVRDVCPANDISVVAYYHDGFTPYKKHRRGYDMRRVCLIPDITEGVGTRVVHNMAGNVPSAGVPSVPLPKRCTRPFREAVVCYDGAHIICCHDWSEELVYGNVLKEPLVDMWYGYDHWSVLCMLHNRDRDFVPCDVCDFHGGYRVGLVQNPFVDRGC